MSPPKDLNIARLTTGKEDAKLRNYLTNCRSVYRQKIEMRQKTERKASSEKRAVSLSSSNMSREEVFQSLRSSSGAPAMPSSLEQRERAKVEARSLDGIRRQRRKNNSAGGREGRQEDLPFRSTGIRPERVIKHSSSPSTHRLSSSTNNLTSASTLSLPLKSSRDRGTIHGSHDRIPPSRRLHPPPHQRRPLSEIYVTGDPTYPLSRRATPKTQRLNQSIELLSSPESWELDGAQGRPMRDPSVSLSQPDDSALSPSSSTLFRSSHDTSLKPSQSVEHGLGPLRQVSAPSSSSSSVGYSTRKSDSVVPKSFAGGSSYTLPQTKKQSPTTPPSPTPPPLPSVPPPSSGVNQPTFVPPGGGRFTRKLPAYPVTESDSLAAEISDLQDRIALLSNQLLYEKADVYTRLHRAGLPPTPLSLFLSPSPPLLTPSSSLSSLPLPLSSLPSPSLPPLSLFTSPLLLISPFPSPSPPLPLFSPSPPLPLPSPSPSISHSPFPLPLPLPLSLSLPLPLPLPLPIPLPLSLSLASSSFPWFYVYIYTPTAGYSCIYRNLRGL